MKKLLFAILLMVASFAYSQTCLTRNVVKDLNKNEAFRGETEVCFYPESRIITFLGAEFNVIDQWNDEEGDHWKMTLNPGAKYVLFGFDYDDGLIYVYSKELNIDLILK